MKHPVVKFSNKNNFKFFNHKFQPITKCYFFGDSNNPNLILSYDFARDLWSRKEVSISFIIDSYCFRFLIIYVYNLTLWQSGLRMEIFLSQVASTLASPMFLDLSTCTTPRTRSAQRKLSYAKAGTRTPWPIRATLFMQSEEDLLMECLRVVKGTPST